VAAIDRLREDYNDGDDSEGSYLITQAACKMQLTRFWLSGDKICPAWSSFSLQRVKNLNSQLHKVTERTVCTYDSRNDSRNVYVCCGSTEGWDDLISEKSVMCSLAFPKESFVGIRAILRNNQLLS